MIDFRIVTRAIGMVNLTSRHTGEYLASVIRDRLDFLGIKTSQLIAITTDNATNMTSMIECLNKAFDENIDVIDAGDVDDGEPEAESENPEENCSEFIFSDENDYDVILKNVITEMEIEELCTDKLETEVGPDLDSILQEIQTIISSHTLNIHSIRCAIHTLQLGVIAALDVDEFEILIKLCRGVCKELRKKTFKLNWKKTALSSRSHVST